MICQPAVPALDLAATALVEAPGTAALVLVVTDYRSSGFPSENRFHWSGLP
jgi:hypothetical protein